jgi:hypothetical protein
MGANSRSNVVMAYEGLPSHRLEPMPATLNRASRELLKFVEMIGDLEDAVGEAIAGVGPTRAVQIQELQKLDHVRQLILGAADFLHALTENMPADWRVDARKAARSVRLADLAGRLGDSEPSVREDASTGESYELFD